ncbi:hypothetical protein DPX16_11241 [Anabarilius grahami]|uniref:Zona pellucida sperm-binding protein 1/4 Ig-like domain-containing protein n=1 Tax=Anabarilius grahami TaxID=495550 RepID=A0A3N0Y3H3_ANAGA|nr:hypothetical protein DPX16_11241 [Anabarilius grahami]
MPWTKGILLFTMVVMTLISSLRAGPWVFSETGDVFGAVSEDTIRFGKLVIGAQERFHLAEAKLHHLGPSVHCGSDSMTLRIPGAIRTPHFLVDRGDQSIVPLSEMPASCGFSLKRARRDVSLVAPYQGCHVRLQDGSYVLPLLVMGAPVQMSCPASRLIPTVSCFPSSMTISLGVGVDDVKVKVDGSWQPLLLTPSKCSFTLETVDGSLVLTAPFIGSCLEVKDAEMQLSLMYGDREVTLSCPVTPMLAPTTTAPVQDLLDSQQMFYPSPFGKPWWYHPHSPGYPVPPTTPPPQDPNQHVFPHILSSSDVILRCTQCSMGFKSFVRPGTAALYGYRRHAVNSKLRFRASDVVTPSYRATRSVTAASLTRCERASDVIVGVFHLEKLTDISTILSQRSSLPNQVLVPPSVELSGNGATALKC